MPRQMGSLLAAPTDVVRVLQNHLNLNAASLGSNQRLGKLWQRELLDGYQDFSLR